MPIEIIAEVGVNHNGDTALCLELLEAAAGAGADTVKFQTFDAESGVAKTAPKAAYQLDTTDPSESQFDMLKRLELPKDAYPTLVQRCRELDVEFLSTPFDLRSLEFLIDEVNVSRLKVASGEVTNGPLLVAMGRANRPVLLSTGMSTIKEIRAALGALAFGFLDDQSTPSLDRFAKAFSSEAGQAVLTERVAVLHCVTSYPVDIGDANVRAVETLGQAFGLPVGYSDHTQGMAAPLAAAALGATVIEKHFTLDTNLPGPDHKASMEPRAFADMVTLIREIDKSLGNGEKIPSAKELKILEIARRSLTALENIEEGDAYSSKTVGVQRPGTGISPMEYWGTINTLSSRAYHPGELIEKP